MKWNKLFYLINTNYKDKRDDGLLHLIWLFSIDSLKWASGPDLLGRSLSAFIQRLLSSALNDFSTVLRPLASLGPTVRPRLGLLSQNGRPRPNRPGRDLIKFNFSSNLSWIRFEFSFGPISVKFWFDFDLTLYPTYQILVAIAAAKTTAKRTKIIISISVELRISSI